MDKSTLVEYKCYYKSDICVYENKCKYKDTCYFAHSLEELKKPICVNYFTHTSCNDSNCNRLHITETPFLPNFLMNVLNDILNEKRNRNREKERERERKREREQEIEHEREQEIERERKRAKSRAKSRVRSRSPVTENHARLSLDENDKPVKRF